MGPENPGKSVLGNIAYSNTRDVLEGKCLNEIFFFLREWIQLNGLVCQTGDNGTVVGNHNMSMSTLIEELEKLSMGQEQTWSRNNKPSSEILSWVACEL